MNSNLPPSTQPANRSMKTPGGYLFLPRTLSRGAFLKWLRRTHAWIGLWGAALGLLFGFSGILLNHRDILKIQIGKPEQQEIQLALPELRPADPQAMAAWLGSSLGIDTTKAKLRREAGKTVIWNNNPYQQPALWQMTIRNPKRMVQAEYWEGNAFVTIKQSEGNFLSVLTNLHKGTGMGMGWVLLADTLAGGLILLSFTGILLWTGLHGKRLAAACIGLGSLSLIVLFTLQAIGD